MENKHRGELASLLEVLPPVEFCCVYGSALHPNNRDKSSMVDYILGVSDPMQWHSENMKINRDHYSSWMVYLGGAKLIALVADEIGVGVHFNPFVNHNDKMFKYGVVRIDDLLLDILNWEKFYLSGRLLKPVLVLVDKLDIENVNSVNLRAAISAALLLLPSKFTEEDLYMKICSLSYMGDLRMLFAEDRNKDHGVTAVRALVSFLPKTVRGRMGMKLGENEKLTDSGRVIKEVVVGSREEVAACMQKVIRRIVLVSSTRQAISGVLAAGGVNAARYLSSKMCKAWQSWT